MSSVRAHIVHPAFFLLLSGVYFLTAYFGLKFEAVNGFATLVWPPTGIAIAALLLYGRKYAPAIFFGAAVSSWFMGAPLWVAAVIGFGNMLEPLVAERFLRWRGFDHAFSRVSDVLLYDVAAVVAPVVSATIGATCLLAGSSIPLEAYAQTWGAWWLGNAMGALIIGPLLLTWLRPRMRTPLGLRRAGEATLLILLVGAVIGIVFVGRFDQEFLLSPLAFLFAVPLLWAAIRFGPRGTATLVFFISGVIIWVVTTDKVAFVEEDFRARLGAWLFFIALTAAIKMVIAAAFQERVRAQNELERMCRNLEERVDDRTSELRESERRYRDLVELAPDAIFTIKPDGTLATLNSAFEQCTGWSKATYLGKPITSILNPDDVSAVRAWVKGFVPGRQPPIEMRVRTKAGGEKTVETVARALTGPEGEVVGVIGISRDISSRLEAERALRASESRYRRLFETAKDGILILDAETGRISDINPYLCDMLGYWPGEVIGKFLWNIFPKKEQENAKQIFTSIQQAGFTRSKYIPLESAKKESLDAEFVCNKYTVNDESVIQCNVRDVRERKELQRQMAAYTQSLEGSVKERTQSAEQEKSRSLALLGSIADGVVAIDANGNVTHMNAAAAEMLEWDPAEAVGRAYANVVPLSDGDGPIPPRRHPLQMALTTGKPFILTLDVAPLMARRERGGAFPALISAAPVVVERVVGAIMVFRDITHEKELDRAKEEFISIASHQLRTPLAIIAWYTEALLSKRLGSLTEQQGDYVREISRTERRMNELVNALLNTSRLDLGTLEVAEEPVDLGEAVESVLRDLAELIAERGIRVVKEYPPQLRPIVADRNVVHMILQNLLSNAVLYNRKNGAVTIQVTIDKETHITIRDTGYGIPKKDQSHIFDKFFRADNAREIEPGGTGLGLYIVRSLLRRVGGSVWFESEENKGSTFHVLIPTHGAGLP